MKSATAAPEPLDDPPGVRAGSWGLRVPRCPVMANSVVTVFPRITAPAARNKAAAMEALLKLVDFDLPQSLVAAEGDRLLEGARADLKARGIPDADKAPIPAEMFKPQAERRVRLGLTVAELVKANNLQAKPEQLQAHIQELAQSYEQPAQVVAWYMSDRQRMAEVEAVVIEGNVADFVLSKAKVTDKVMGFEELMGQQAAA